MRILTVLGFLALAAPAAAQALGPTDLLALDMQRAQLQAAQRRAIDQANQLEAAQARLRADQAVLDLRFQRGDVGPARIPMLPYAQATSTSTLPPAVYPSIPDALLADSNAKVQAAVERH